MKLIGIAGGSGAGKTSVANDIKSRLTKKTTIISLDSYYNDNSHLSIEKRAKLNFDHPSAFDYDLLYRHLCLLKKGKSIEKPTYSYIEHTRQKETICVLPSEVHIIEGILLFFDDRIVNLLDYKLFIDLDKQHRLENIIKRDVKERGRDKKEVIQRFYEEVNPMHEKFVKGQKNKANYIVKSCFELKEACNIIYNHLKTENLC